VKSEENIVLREKETGKIMKRKNWVLLALTAFASLATGCARNYAGTYTGTQTLTITSPQQMPVGGYNGVVAGNQPITGALTLTINQSSSTLLTGTWSANGQTGMFEGTAAGDSITAIRLTLTGIPTTGVNQTSPYGYGALSPLQSGACNSFTGTLTVTQNNQLTGTLTVIPSATAQVTPGYGTPMICTGTSMVTATKTN
jgi:hypothetical protein